MNGRFRRNHIAAAKLDSMKVLRIRQLYEEGWSQGRLARESEELFGVSISVGQIGRIVRGEAWKEYSKIGETSSEVLHRMAKREFNSGPTDDEIQRSLARFNELMAKETTTEPVESIGFSRLEAELNNLDADQGKQVENELNAFLDEGSEPPSSTG